MKALIQRVSQASVDVSEVTVGKINRGLLLLLGVEKTDTHEVADRLLHKVLHYRLFSDEQHKMNLSVLDVKGSLLIVSQFTLVADTHKGLRPSFSAGATPALGNALYDYFVNQARTHMDVSTGQFGADMQVQLTNDGPVTFLLETT